jgi:hypothetical protein
MASDGDVTSYNAFSVGMVSIRDILRSTGRYQDAENRDFGHLPAALWLTNGSLGLKTH